MFLMCIVFGLLFQVSHKKKLLLIFVVNSRLARTSSKFTRTAAQHSATIVALSSMDLFIRVFNVQVCIHICCDCCMDLTNLAIDAPIVDIEPACCRREVIAMASRDFADILKIRYFSICGLDLWTYCDGKSFASPCSVTSTAYTLSLVTHGIVV